MTQPSNKLRQELVSHFRAKRTLLRQQWVRQMRAQGLLQHASRPDILETFGTLYDTCVHCLDHGTDAVALTYARATAESSWLTRLPQEQLLQGWLAVHDVCRRSLYARYRTDVRQLEQALEIYTAMANRLLTLWPSATVDSHEPLLAHKIRQLQMLVRAGMIVTSQLSLNAVLQRIVNMACKVVHARYGALGVLDGQGGLSQFITAGINERTKRAIGPLPLGKGILGVLVHEATLLRLKDLTKDHRAHGFPAHHPPMRSFLGVPIVSKGKAFGNLYLTEKEGAEAFSEEDQTLAVTLATQAAIAIENASLYEALQRSYEELKRSQDLLLRQEKLASLGRLSAGLAHELNNPLHIIAGFIEVLQRRSQAEALLACQEFAEFPTFLQMAQQEVDRAASIVRRLLDFARQREPAFDQVELGRLIAETIALVQRQATVTNQRLIVELQPEPIWVHADAQMLQQVLLNLLTNALDAITGGEIRLAVQVQGATQRGPHEPSRVELTIADNGCGIAPEHLSKIFDPFFTTKEVGKGTGLGLPICQSIIEQHGGTIEVTSQGIDQGTTVMVKLPLHRAD